MMSISIFMLVAIFLVFLLLVAGNGQGKEQTGDASGPCPGESREVRLPPELVVRIFSREDRDYIFRMRSLRLQRIYKVERRQVALHWVRRTSREAQRIMRAHRLNSRQSRDLEVATEASLLFQYLNLRLVFGLLGLLIRAFGPHALGDLAAHASELYQRIGRILPDGSLGRNPITSEDTATH